MQLERHIIKVNKHLSVAGIMFPKLDSCILIGDISLSVQDAKILKQALADVIDFCTQMENKSKKDFRDKVIQHIQNVTK